MADDEKEFDERITLNIVHHFPDNVPLTFADNVAVQHTPSEFTITFAQVRQPLVAKMSEYDKLENIRADVVARIVLTPSKLVELIQALQENLGIYKRRMQALKDQLEKDKANAGATDNSTSGD
jgi:Protein of unknown function (DUF3467)